MQRVIHNPPGPGSTPLPTSTRALFRWDGVGMATARLMRREALAFMNYIIEDEQKVRPVRAYYSPRRDFIFLVRWTSHVELLRSGYVYLGYL